MRDCDYIPKNKLVIIKLVVGKVFFRPSQSVSMSLKKEIGEPR